MKIIVIGHPCLDIIHKNQKEFENYGGIIYSLIGFLLVAQDEDEIYPIFSINHNHFAKYFEITENHKQIRKNFISIDSSPMNIVHLFMEGEELSFECYQSRAPKIDIKKIKQNIPADCNFYFNMVSGFEIELSDLKFLRENFQGKIYFDFHTLTRGINKDGKRVYRPIENWRKWVSFCDVIQLNETEMKNLTSEGYNEDKFVDESIRTGCKVVNITKGSKGAITYFLDNSEIKSIKAYPEENLNFKSNVGCGDIFGAVFSYNYFRNESIETCLKEAVKFSSRRIEIENIKDILKKIKKN